VFFESVRIIVEKIGHRGVAGDTVVADVEPPNRLDTWETAS
jgi:hypothetical protein